MVSCNPPDLLQESLGPEGPERLLWQVGGVASGVFTIHFKLITCMKVLFLNDLGDCSYSVQGSSS